MSVSKQKMVELANPFKKSLGINAQQIVGKRYSLKDLQGKALETWDDIVKRVVFHVAKAEKDSGKREDFITNLMRLMDGRAFIPNTPCLVNAGKPKGQLAACFVLPVPDSLDGIMEHAKYCALIHQSGGGCISADARVWSTFCGLETIEVLFHRATTDGRAGVANGNGVAFDVSDLNIQTASMNPATGETGLRQVTHVWKFDVPASDQLVVTTREGVKVQTSRWHPFMVLRGTAFKELRADELRAGDVILTPEKPDDYWPWREYRQVRGTTVDADLAWLIGFTLGDGSFGYLPSQRLQRLRLFSGTTDVLEKAQTVIAKLGTELKIYQDKRGLYSLNTLNQGVIYTMLEACGLENIGPKDTRIRIPEIIAKSPLDCVRAFLAGLLDSDGQVDKDGSPSYSTASVEMAEDVAALCSLLGYQPRLHAKQPHGKGRQVVYTVQLCILPQVNRLAEDLKPYLANEKRRARLQSESRRQLRLHVEIEPWRDELRELGLARTRQQGHGDTGAVAAELNRWSCDTDGRCNRDDLSRIANLMSEKGSALGNLLHRVAEYGIEVEAVSPAAERKDFYDLSVAEWNTYAAGTHGLAMIHNTGMTYELLRPAGTPVGEGRGVASGPVSFMQIVNTMTETVKQGGVRRGANMGILAVSHPDILRFIHAKNDQKSLTNFNISVTVSDKFLQAVENQEWFQTEFDGKPWNVAIHDPKANDGQGGDYTYKSEAPPQPGMIYAPDIWERIISSTHRWAEPGIIFIDNVNRHNPLQNSMGLKKASNPCAEQLLHDYNACNLGSIDVAKYYDELTDDVDWERFGKDIAWCVRFLDNVIDTCAWPLPQIDDTVKRTRPVGLGIMGFADLCLHKRIAYGSEESALLAHHMMDFFRKESWKASLQLGAEKGAMPEFEPNRDLYEKLIYEEVGLDRSLPLTPRNYEVTTVAPTGTISLVAETSSGCEPNFSYAYVRRDTIGTRTYAHPIAAKALGFDVDQTNPESIAKAAQAIVENRDKLPEYFVDAMTLDPDDHLRVLKAFQDHVDNSISKTVNAPSSYTVADTDRVHRLAWKMGVKAVSYYRDGSRDGQVLTAMTTEKKEEPKAEALVATQIAEAEVAAPIAAVTTKAATIARPKVERPRELLGATWQVPFDGQNLYVTINHDGSRVLEVFATGAGLSVSVGLLASKMLRGGFEPEEVANSLNKVIGNHSVWFNERLCTSTEQVVAECIRLTKRRLMNQPDSARAAKALAQAAASPANATAPQAAKPAPGKFATVCPECSSENMVVESGCVRCEDCSWSKCS
jgi:ribonucleoside-diphosphate reductase alpha chain